MWPWEHAIVGYLAYSVFSHCYYRRSPDGLEAFTAVFASVLPDLIDKPLAWEYGVFTTGYALGHSIFFAVPLSIIVGLLARRARRTGVGIAFGLGYLLHLPADVLDGYLRGGRVRTELMLWPVETVGSADERTGFSAEFLRLFGRYQQELLAGELSTYVQLQLALAGVVFALWIVDGAPVLRECLVGSKRLLRRLLGRSERSVPSSDERT
ncbi:metal-dependent hydrolase [Natrarchaeobius halalkaliphilus]|uniref:Metal-dependent hydrolase n=1 Tax=Natrarchaeobius halalkaliphilus TaxID=1679091 RepID=A0A3N6P3I2_9EURY|nr:metal-dependent hydrolase [Natrarchaeobius halalkaliphilus]RQG89845.1 metal-dependent hydrolase [Natrarchaeobius halalkaliphilus]